MLKNKYFKLHLEEANSFRKRNFGFIIFKRVLVTILLVVAIGFLVSLWLSPKAKTRTDMLYNCLEGRGYNVINK